jgi:hypothetical protein
MHHYTLIPIDHQREAIVKSGALKTLPEHISEIDKFSQEMKICQQAIAHLERLIGALKTFQDPVYVLRDLEKISFPIIERFQHAVWLNDNTPDIYEYGKKALAAYPRQLQEIRLPWLISSYEANLIEQMLTIQKIKLEIATEKVYAAYLSSFLEKIKLSPHSTKELLKELPNEVVSQLHSLIYQSHAKKFGIAHVDDKTFNAKYGRIALEDKDPRSILFDAKESVLNIWGENIVEQLISEYQIKSEKLQCHYEKEQLLAFHRLLLYPAYELSHYQLYKAFEMLDIRYELKEKLYWSIWYSHRQPQILNYGTTTFGNNPRCLLSVQEPHLARPPICALGTNILFQMIKLLEKEAE